VIKHGDKITTRDPTPCVFCAGEVSITDDAPGAVCHTFPMCAEFERLEPGEFLDASIKRAVELARRDGKVGHC